MNERPDAPESTLRQAPDWNPGTVNREEKAEEPISGELAGARIAREAGRPGVPWGRRLLRTGHRASPLLVWCALASASVWLAHSEPPATHAVASAESGHLRVVSEAPGRVLKILVAEGQNVNAGEALVVLDSGDLDERLSRCRAVVERLRAKAAAGPDGRDSGEAAGKDDLLVFEERLAELRREKERYTLRAPDPGQVERVLCDLGAWVHRGGDVAILETGHRGRLVACLGEGHRLPLARGTRVLLRPRQSPGSILEGRVIRTVWSPPPGGPRAHGGLHPPASGGREVTIQVDPTVELSPLEVFDVTFLP